MKHPKINIDSIGIFRKAEPRDIIEGNTVYLITDNGFLIKKIIEEVLSPDDEYKAFSAEDGCRYGLNDLYVLKNKSDLDNKIQRLEKAIEDMLTIINTL